MVSIYFAIGIYYVIGIVTYGAYRWGGTGEMSRFHAGILYAASRLTPILMLPQRSAWVWINLVLDLIVFLMVNRLTRVKEEGACGRGCVLYLLNPVVLLAILSGRIWMIGIVWVVVLAVLLVVRWAEGRIPHFSAMEFYLEYAFFHLFALLGWGAVEHYGQSLEWTTRQGAKAPLMLLLMMLGCSIAAASVLFKFIGWGKRPLLFPIEKWCRSVDTLVPENKLTRWDAVIMVALTVGCALLTYGNLGSLSVPANSYHMQRGENHEIVLDLGAEARVERIDIYLGHKNKRTFSFSCIEPGEAQWSLLESKRMLNNPYVWHQIKIEETTRYLGIVSKDVSSEILEMVILGRDGKQILPKNAEKYQELFDEQEHYPKYQTYFDRMIFDELHHARTAYDYLYGPPFSEVTHPPLGKVLISAGIKLFGMNPFGWRFTCALFGVLMVPLMYLFAWRISRKTEVAATAAVLLCTEFMHFALSRISTLDMIIAFFILLMFYLMYCFADGLMRGYPLKSLCRTLVLCGCATGCALAVKWTGGYAAAGIAIAFFSFLIPYCAKHHWNEKIRRELPILFVVCVVSFVVIPCGIYVLSYVPFARWYPEKSLLQSVVDNSVFMLTYHVDAVFDHPYASEWYTWLIDKRPLLDAFGKVEGGLVSSISTFGSPLVVWGGLLSLVHHVYLWMCKGNQTAKFLTIAYLSLLMPWWFIHRTVFIYQYFGCILILVLMLAHSAMQSQTHQRSSLAVLAGASCVLFLMFYPVISGQEVSVSYVRTVLQWFDSWTFA